MKKNCGIKTSIEDIDKPHKLEEAKKWERAKRKPKTLSTKPPPKKKQKIDTHAEEYSGSEVEMDEDDDSGYEIDLFVPRIVRSVSSSECSFCGHQRSFGTVPLACFDCSQYWLCSPCRTNTNALAEHMKTHESDPTLDPKALYINGKDVY